MSATFLSTRNALSSQLECNRQAPKHDGQRQCLVRAATTRHDGPDQDAQIKDHDDQCWQSQHGKNEEQVESVAWSAARSIRS